MAGWQNPLPQVRTVDSMWMRTILQSLEAWSGTATGIPVTWTVGTYQRTPMSTTAVQTVALTLNRSYATAIYVPSGSSIDRVAIEVTSAGGTGSVVRFGLYTDSDGKPGSKLFDAGTVDTAASTGFKELTVSWRNLDGGWYWILTVPQVGTGPTVRQPAAPMSGFAPYRSATAGNTPDSWWVYGAAISGALPSSFGAVTGTVSGPLVLFRAA